MMQNSKIIICSLVVVVIMLFLVFHQQENITQILKTSHHAVVSKSYQFLGLEYSRPKLNISWDEQAIKHHLWPEDDECKHFTTRFAMNGSLPTQALVSFPGSGNTWSRYLIEAATGLYTGSIYYAPLIDQKGHHGEKREFNDGSTIMQKTHYSALYGIGPKSKSWRREEMEKFSKSGVLIIRNPYDAMLSYANLIATGSQTNEAKQLNFADFKRKEFVYLCVARWFEIIQDWLLQPPVNTKVHVILYENMKADPVAHMRDLVKYLGLDVDEGRMKCLAKESEGAFHRKHMKKDSPYNSDQHIMVDSIIEKTDRLLREKFGWGLPLDLYQYYSIQETLDEEDIKLDISLTDKK